MIISPSESAFRRISRAVKAFEQWAERKKAARARSPGKVTTRFYIVQSAGPAAEADYSDERYWIQLAELTNSDSDETSKLTFAVIASTDPRYRYVTGTNLVELADESHNLESGAVVPAMIVFSSSSPTVPRHVFAFPA